MLLLLARLVPALLLLLLLPGLLLLLRRLMTALLLLTRLLAAALLLLAGALILMLAHSRSFHRGWVFVAELPDPPSANNVRSRASFRRPGATRTEGTCAALSSSFSINSGSDAMGRYLLLWLLGIPLPILFLIWIFGGLH